MDTIEQNAMKFATETVVLTAPFQSKQEAYRRGRLQGFRAGATFMHQSAISLAKGDFNFICEIIDDLKGNGYTEDSMAAVMLNDWRGELEERLNEE
jgi:hypothetical protein